MTIYHFLTLSSILFCIGVSGILISGKNMIRVLMSIELMLLSINIMFVAFSAFSSDIAGQIISLLVLTVAGAEAAIGLAIVVIYANTKGDIEVSNASSLKG